MATARIHVDGRALEVEEGKNLLVALLEAGRSIPHPCFHPALSAPASCRLCVAAVDAAQGRQLVTTCNRTVSDGLELSLDAPEVSGARARLVDDLLLRHPAECGVCERAGECELQETVYRCGNARTAAIREEAPERVVLGPRLLVDRRRCILCTRCVRFGEEISGHAELAVEGSGAVARIAACAGGSVEPDGMSGNLLDLCPAGALIEPGERFAPPPWRLTGVASVCAGCASGCPTRVDHDGQRVWRVKPRPVDGGLWLCDHGRYGWEPEGERLPAPRLGAAEAEWDAALAAVAEGMDQASNAAVLLSPYQTNEEAFLLIQLAQRWKARPFLWELEHPDGDRTFPGGFTVHASRGPNAAGVRSVAAAVGVTLADEAALARDGGVDGLYAVGGSLCGEGPRVTIPDDAFLVAHEACVAPHLEAADVVLAGGSAWAEKDGTFVDGAGRLQRVRAAVVPTGQARTDLWILSALWHGGPNRDTIEQVFSRLARTGREPFAGRDYGGLEPTSKAVGVAFGGGWTSWLQLRGLIPVEDHTRNR